MTKNSHSQVFTLFTLMTMTTKRNLQTACVLTALFSLFHIQAVSAETASEEAEAIPLRASAAEPVVPNVTSPSAGAVVGSKLAIKPVESGAKEVPLPAEKLTGHDPKDSSEVWVIQPNDGTVRRALNRWAARAGWQVAWEAAVDLPVTVTARFHGDFRTALHELFASLTAADVSLNVLLYNGNRVARVVESGQRAQ